MVKDSSYNVHLYPYDWSAAPEQLDLLEADRNAPAPLTFEQKL
ncbi:MAG TPA: hypothetical protein P5026_05010 [Kiritimatiellia bacterium]|nr:hypothetical protein [Kiritimatiellia bacterium]HRU70461.1 hypothetical protein [Kiritimatiellia bacterium]